MAKKKETASKKETAPKKEVVAKKEKVTEKLRMFKTIKGTLVHPQLFTRFTGTPVPFGPPDSWLDCQIKAGKIVEC